ncbi:MAG TPA: phosphoenolpyruvate--protein phosphotransferase [Vicinamibacterales bacterium]
MASAYRFTCPLASGMHARPASALEHLARRFTADVSLTNDRTGQSANAKSVLGIVGLDIRHGDPCRIETVGRDAAWAAESLKVFIEQTLPRADDVPVVSERRPEDVRLPPVLRQANAVVNPGTAVVGGIGLGRAFAVGGFTVPDSIPLTGVDDVEAEVQRVEEALGRLLSHYDGRLDANDDGVEADVLRAHRSVARDPEFSRTIVHAIRARGCTAAGAVAEAEAQFTGMLAATGSAVLRERALDIRDVCRALLHQLYGKALPRDEIGLSGDSVCVAETLTPGQFLALDRQWLKGLVLAHGGTTSHTVILARAGGIPTVVGVEGLDAAALDGQDVVVDADLGIVVTALTDGARRYYDMERLRLEQRRVRVHRFIERPATTEDGHRIEVAANVGSAGEVSQAVAGGAEGIGLFRTEMLFLARKDAPSEDEQFEQYRRAVVDARGRAVIVRTLDIGGDKPLPYLAMPKEDNPFLGYRAVRIYPEFEGLFRSQVRALIRATAFGRLQVMIPMVSCLDEVTWVRGIIADEQSRLATEGVAFDPGMPLGAMIEVPSAAFIIGPLSEALDFFSVGTNDLLQYFLAADRANARLTALANPLEPSFLRLLDHIVSDVHACGRWVGLCGEMGGQPRYLPVLVGLGLDEISLATPEIASTKALLTGLSAARCRALVEQAMKASTARDVARLLDQRDHWRPLPLTEPGLVRVNADCRTKEEAIKSAVDLLYAAGRTDRPRDVEEAVWQREATSSTGFGHGFAIPHGKTDAVGANSMAIVKLRAGVSWGSPDDQPVRTLILLAIRDTDQATTHMRVLASLARRLMHEKFRNQVEREQDPTALCRLLHEQTESI